MARAFLQIISNRAISLQSKRVKPLSEETVVTADEGYDGLSSVTVEGTGREEMLFQSKAVTPSSRDITVVADEGYDALSSVTVSGDPALSAENIKKGATVFGVAGSYEGAVTVYAEGVSF